MSSERAAGGGRLPDFFIVGHPKSGTTALYEMLLRHPQIYMPPRKEPWFFAAELHERTPPRPGGTPSTMAEYLQWFAGARPDQRVGEASPLYLWSRTAAARIASAAPGARIVAILREPASFLHSLHLQFLQSHIEVEPDFAKALSLESPRREGLQLPRHSYWPRALAYSEHVRYVEQLRRYEAVFPREQILVLIYEDFRADNEQTVRQVLHFLEVEERVPIAASRANPSVRVRSSRAYEALHALTVGRGPLSARAKTLARALTPRRLRRGAVALAERRLLFADPAPPDEELMRVLRRRYKPEVEALSEHLGRDLVRFWGYELID